jgi:DNA polymerase-3 subunit delta'
MKNIFPWQENTWQQLQSNYNCQRMPHAWLLTGNKGIGKIQFSQHMAAWLFCTAGTPHPCGQCKACQLLNAQQHPDFYWLKADDKEAYNTQNIRLLRNNLLQSAQQGSVKVILMEAADKLTIAAANALLKMIEEPPQDVYFILVTERPMLLPITLRSRCQLIHSPVPEPQEAIKWLAQQTQQAEETIGKALQLAYGAPLTALTLINEPQLLTEFQKNANDFLAVISGKRSALAVAADWANSDESRLIEIVQYCLRRIVRNVTGVTGQGKPQSQAFTNVPVNNWFKLYDEALLGYQRLLITPGLSRQLFWEHFLLMAQDMTSLNAHSK